MSDDRYRKIFEDLTSDLLTVAKRHGKRALREAVRDAANGNLLQEEDDEQNSDVPPEELDYPDEDVWTLPPAPEEGTDEDTDDGKDGLSDAAERVLDRLMDKMVDRAEK